MTESVTNGITPNEIVIPAGDVTKGDVLIVPAHGGDKEHVVNQSMLHVASPTMRLLTFATRAPVLRFNDELVRVRRPVPTVTIEVELTQEEADAYVTYFLNTSSAAKQRASFKFRDAIMAARAKETTP